MVLYWKWTERHLGGALIIESKVIYLFDSEDKIAEGVLTTKDHLDYIRSNVPWLKIEGPLSYHG